MHYVKGNSRCQLELPLSLDDYVASDNPVRVIDTFVDILDLGKLKFLKATLAKTGRPPFDPGDLLRLYIYGYMNGVRSSRKLEAEAERNQEVMWLLRRITPDFKTIADFRRDNKEPMRVVFRQFNELCKEWGLFGKEVVAVDGTKVRASNSKRNNFTAKKVERHLSYLEDRINSYLDELDENDSNEANMPKFSREEIQKKLQELEKRKENYKDLAEKIQKNGEVSTVDTDARLMGVHNNGVDVCYNVQAVVDSKHSLVVDAEAINNPADQGQLGLMAGKAQEMLQVQTIKTLADKGYYTTEDLKKCEAAGIVTYVARPAQSNSTGVREYYQDRFTYNPTDDSYTCPQGRVLTRMNDREDVERKEYRNWKACKQCPVKHLCTPSKRGRKISRSKDQAIMDAVDQRTRDNRELYLTRQLIIEHVFGTLKRTMGFTHFLTRGLESVRVEVSMAFLGYNLKRAINILGAERMIREMAAKMAAISFATIFLKPKFYSNPNLTSNFS